MLKPPTSTAVEPDAEIAMCSSWLEAFAVIVSHSTSISSTSLDASYTFLRKVIMYFCASMAKNTIQNDTPVVDDLLQRVNSTILEAQLMSNDAAVTATELYTHLHMLRRRTVLESPALDQPQRDKDQLLVMSVGGNDLFGPNARKLKSCPESLRNENIGRKVPCPPLPSPLLSLWQPSWYFLSCIFSYMKKTIEGMSLNLLGS